MNKFALPLCSLALAGAFAAHAEVPTHLLGDVVPVDQATRTVDIKPQTRWVNVTEGDVVAFQTNGQSFAIKFDGTPRSFDLAQLAPAGSLDHPVKVYIAPDEIYSR